MFPILLYNYYASYLFNLINLSILHKKIYVDVFFTNRILNLLVVLQKFKFVNNFFIFKNKKKNKIFIRIYFFYYKNASPNKLGKLILKPSHMVPISLKAINLLSKRSGSTIFLISTSSGIITHFEALKKKKSGYIFAYLLV